MEPDRPAAIVTGGARSIGRTIALELISQGWRVGVLDVNPKAIASSQALAEAEAGLLVPLTASITDRSAVTSALGTFSATAGPVRALVNNAGMTLPARFLDQTDEDWDRIVDVNLKGTFIVSQVAARSMVEQGTGAIVNISSISAHGVRTGPPAYAAAKAGVEGLGRLMAVQLGPFGVRVNTVVVGTIGSPWLLSRKTPDELAEMAASTLTGRIGTPADVAGVVAFLCSDAASHVTGQLLSVSGGQWIA
ncbi:SDR family NAD(P)-dependent oxidoreductase [Luedemannella helvata]|uniref:3-oxoacyl-ACP reductase FabG n=1 Tax=Luedemannella helvata TaxID=349315 RepID=A0ABP4VWE7_9ACTN